MSRLIFLSRLQRIGLYSFQKPIPSAVKGKVIHVVGSLFTGYKLEFKRNYDTTKTNRPFQKIPLG